MKPREGSLHERILILDHNIMRFHHYDLMESLISHPPIRELLRGEYQPYLTMGEVDKLLFLKNVNTSYNILEFFEGDSSLAYTHMLNTMINYSGKHTPLNMYFGLDTLTRTSGLEVTIFKFSGDVDYEDGILGPNGKVVIRDDMLDSAAVSSYIKEYNIDLLICDSIDMAIEVGNIVEHSMMFTIPQYGFNFETVGQMKCFRRLGELVALGKTKGHSIGAFNPIKYS